MKEIFVAMSDRITAQVPAVRWVDFDLGQLEMKTPPVSYPCALIAFGSAAYERLGTRQEVGTLNLTVRLAFRLRERTHSKAAANFREEALEHLDVVAAVRTALMGLVGDTFTPFVLTTETNEQRADLRTYSLGFRCDHYIEYPAPQYTDWADLPGSPASPALDPQVEIVPQL